MSAVVQGFEPPLRPVANPAWRNGPVTSARLRRTALIYAGLVVLGLLPLLLTRSASLQAAGVGLWLPGGGFMADGGFAILLFPLFLALFALAFFAWFGSGAVLAPLLIWGGGVALAAGLAGHHIWSLSPYIAALLVAAFFVEIRRRSSQRAAADAVTAARLIAEAPAAEARYAARLQAAAPADATGELDADGIAASRYLFDRALQPVGVFRGYDRRDIFQTAAIRYQINYVGYALAQLQAQFAPSFHGYLSEAQRRAIETYLSPEVWRYWVYESIWGHFNLTDWNPAAKDNIMLTGYYLPQLALYKTNTGDDRYGAPGSLVFRLSDKRSWPHSAHSIKESIAENFKQSAYCLYPCEPNWIYPGCNFRGMLGLASYDAAYGTHEVSDVLTPFLRGLEDEFTSATGGVLPLRSSITGIPLPFPSPDLGLVSMINVFAPARAQRKWAVGVAELEKSVRTVDGLEILDLPNDSIDFGNYKPGSRTFNAAGIQVAAAEMGDVRIAEAARNTLDLYSERTLSGGALSYAKGSNLANLFAVSGRMARRNSQRDLHNGTPSDATRRGPILEEARYPDVLVARAVSDGVGLELVLYGGNTAAGTPEIGLGRLSPGQNYMVADRPDLAFRADDAGRAKLKIELRGRTPLSIRPL